MKRTSIAKATLVLLMGLFASAVLSNGGGTGHSVVQGIDAQGETIVQTRGYNNPSAYIGHADEAQAVVQTRGYNNPSAYIGHADEAQAVATDEAAYEGLRSAFGPEAWAAVLADTACPEPGSDAMAADNPSPSLLMGLMLTEETFADLNRPPIQSAEEALAEAEDLNKALEPTAAGPAAKACN